MFNVLASVTAVEPVDGAGLAHPESAMLITSTTAITLSKTLFIKQIPPSIYLQSQVPQRSKNIAIVLSTIQEE
jgi:hypothetical protein